MSEDLLQSDVMSVGTMVLFGLISLYWHIGRLGGVIGSLRLGSVRIHLMSEFCVTALNLTIMMAGKRVVEGFVEIGHCRCCHQGPQQA